MLDEKLDTAFAEILRRNPGEVEFHQAVARGARSRSARCSAKHPEYAEHKIIERICEPERQIIFRVPWQDDQGEVQINRGFRVEFNSALGPYKGGLRFHPSVNLGIVKFLGFEQIFKNALTGMPIGGGKGGSDFDPKGRSRRRGHAVLPELHDRAVPPPRRVHRRAGRRHRRRRPRDRLPVRPVQAHHQPLRVRRPHRQGHRAGAARWCAPRRPATAPSTSSTRCSRARGESLDGKTCVVSGSGNVAIYAIEKIQQLGGNGRRLLRLRRLRASTRRASTSTLLKQIKEVERGRIARLRRAPRRRAYLRPGGNIWDVPCDVAHALRHPERARRAATRSTLVRQRVHRGRRGGEHADHARGRSESSRRPASRSAPARRPTPAAWRPRAGDAAERQPRLAGRFEHTEGRLAEIMADIHDTCCETAEEYGAPGNYVGGRQHRRLPARRRGDARLRDHLRADMARSALVPNRVPSARTDRMVAKS